MQDMNKVHLMILLIIFLTLYQVDPAYSVCDEHCSKCEADTCLTCNYGYWGHHCHRDCINCWVGGCEKDSGRCFQCDPGYFGVHCDKVCPANCLSSIHDDKADCNRHSGNCLQGCEVGWWGEQCHKRCSSGCQGACYQHDGACVSDCKKGLFGRFCNKTCSPGCAEGSCSWLNGICHGGCKCGYYGETCEDTCSSNCNNPCKFDEECQCLTCGNICDGQCLEGRCHQNGSCVDGCQDGFYGDQCLQSCPAVCSDCVGDPGCSSCFDKMITSHCLHSSNEIIGVVKIDDDIRDAETQLTGDVAFGRMSSVLFISCLLGVQLV